MKWCPPLPKTSGLFGLSRQDLYKRESSKERFVTKTGQILLQEKMEFWVGVWEGFRFIGPIDTPKTLWFNKDFDIERYSEE